MDRFWNTLSTFMAATMHGWTGRKRPNIMDAIQKTNALKEEQQSEGLLEAYVIEAFFKVIQDLRTTHQTEAKVRESQENIAVWMNANEEKNHRQLEDESLVTIFNAVKALVSTYHAYYLEDLRKAGTNSGKDKAVAQPDDAYSEILKMTRNFLASPEELKEFFKAARGDNAPVHNHFHLELPRLENRPEGEQALAHGAVGGGDGENQSDTDLMQEVPVNNGVEDGSSQEDDDQEEDGFGSGEEDDDQEEDDSGSRKEDDDQEEDDSGSRKGDDISIFNALQVDSDPEDSNDQEDLGGINSDSGDGPGLGTKRKKRSGEVQGPQQKKQYPQNLWSSEILRKNLGIDPKHFRFPGKSKPDWNVLLMLLYKHLKGETIVYNEQNPHHTNFKNQLLTWMENSTEKNWENPEILKKFFQKVEERIDHAAQLSR